MAQITFADCMLFTDADLDGLPYDLVAGIKVFPIDKITSSSAYSDFLLHDLADHVATSHCLIVQWDGYVLDHRRWLPQFLDYDYIGASWPQFDDGHDVGNGGFSLRSRALLKACQAPEFRPVHPEDVAIGRHNRAWLETCGFRFAPRALADCFATERRGDLAASFGYHGVYNMPRAAGLERFWQTYLTLDERSAVHHDLTTLLRALGGGRNALSRRSQMLLRYVRDRIGSSRGG
ncbi:DUF5672 family protein [Sphingomonas sp. UYP23]